VRDDRVVRPGEGEHVDRPPELRAQPRGERAAVEHQTTLDGRQSGASQVEERTDRQLAGLDDEPGRRTRRVVAASGRQHRSDRSEPFAHRAVAHVAEMGDQVDAGDRREHGVGKIGGAGRVIVGVREQRDAPRVEHVDRGVVAHARWHSARRPPRGQGRSRYARLGFLVCSHLGRSCLRCMTSRET